MLLICVYFCNRSSDSGAAMLYLPFQYVVVSIVTAPPQGLVRQAQHFLNIFKLNIF